MIKVPLSQEGITQLETNLYALSDPALFAESEAAHQDFVSWVDGHITLTAGQLAWLGGIDPLFLKLLGIKTAIALRNKLTLKIKLPSASATGGKWIMDKDPITPKWVDPGIILATGALSFELGYT